MGEGKGNKKEKRAGESNKEDKTRKKMKGGNYFGMSQGIYNKDRDFWEYIKGHDFINLYEK